MAPSRIHYYIASSILLLTSLFLLSHSHSPLQDKIFHSKTTSSRSLSARDKSKINNSTLGFTHIYALGLPSRSDRRDSLDLAATLTNLTITWRSGVNGTTMSPKAVPPAHGNGAGEILEDAVLGCWRGHMDIIREIVTSGVASALILEDDADWDVPIRGQMEGLARGVRETIGKVPGEMRDCRAVSGGNGDSPYGACWDMLWVGHCGGWAPNDHHRDFYAVVGGDETVPPVWDIMDFSNGIEEPCAAHEGRELEGGVVCHDPSLKGDERIVQYKPSPVCTAGYAISQQGARKMLARLGGLSLSDVDAPIDTELTELCRGDKDGGNRSPFQCLTITPPLISVFRPKGKRDGESDIRHVEGEREIGLTRGAKYSARMNVETLIKGLEPESQYVKDAKSGKWRYRTLKEYEVY